MFFKHHFLIILVTLSFSILFLFLYFSFTKPSHLIFSDSAKYADLARNIVQSRGYGLNFSFWINSGPSLNTGALFDTLILPIHPLIIATSFKLFGISDTSVILVSILFYILSTLLIYLIGLKLFGKLTGFLSSAAFAATPDILNYAVSGGTESIFIFEILLSIYLFAERERTRNILGLLTLVIMYFTRPQAFIYIAGIILFWLLTNYNYKKSASYFTLIIIGGLLLDVFVLSYLSGRFFLYSILDRGAFSALSLGAGQVSSDILRGSVGALEIVDLGKKIFYNLYNFYRLAPQIINPYLLTLFVIEILHYHKNKTVNAFKWASLFMIVLTLLVVAASIPLFRYIHPVIPLIYLLAIDNLVWIVEEIYKLQTNYKQITKPVFVNLISFFLVFIFVIGQTSGIIFLDSRFERITHNIGKPPIYVEMSKKLKDITKSDDVIITNLDTWGSWYGERKTVWFPVEPSMLDLGGKGKFDAIYLTNYLMNDENYLIGEAWRQIFENPTNIENDYIRDNYVFEREVVFPLDDNYERMEGKAVLLRKKL